MIFQGINCTVYEPSSIELDMSMEPKRDSKGKPVWVDYGGAYDCLRLNLVISATGADRADLESVIREQNTSDSITITFENGEFLYDFTSTFTIQDWELIDNPVKWVEYGFKLELAPVDVLDFKALPGERSTDCGNFTYSTAVIEQPMQFNQQYNTLKYPVATHGSSSSSELPTNDYDSTAWKSRMLAGNCRQLVDTILTDRGTAFFVTFPNESYPFGVHSSGVTGQRLCITSKSKYVFELVNGYIWKASLGVYAL